MAIVDTRDDGQEQDGRPSSRYDEALRPQFHFTAPQNWLNDPNGLVFYKGEYHLFYQHNPFGLRWGNITWGHAVSRDLLRWKQLPHALEPDKLGLIYSGSAVVDWNNTTDFQSGKEKTLVAIYTAAGDESPASKGQSYTQCLAYSTNRGRKWTKYFRNPILKNIVGSNRDPKVAWHGPTQQWIMALYLDKNDFSLFASPDLKSWTHLHNLTLPGSEECPDFFPLWGDDGHNAPRWVFTAANGQYLVGSFDGQKFVPEGEPQRMDYGANFYAGQTFNDIPAMDARRIQIAWMRGGQYPGMPFNQQMTFPCVLTLRKRSEGLRLYRWPVRELTSLSIKEQRWHNVTLKPEKNPLEGIIGELWDLVAEFQLQDATEFGLMVRGEAIRYNVAARTLTCLGCTAPLEPEENHIMLRVLVDRASIEVFGNFGRVSLTSCFQPNPDEQGLSVFAVDGGVKIVSLKVRPLNSAMQQTE